jgi:hypothetical protein
VQPSARGLQTADLAVSGLLARDQDDIWSQVNVSVNFRLVAKYNHFSCNPLRVMSPKQRYAYPGDSHE